LGTNSLSSAVENLKTTFNAVTEDGEEEEINVQFMNDLMKELKLRKMRDNMTEMEDAG